MNHKVLVEFTVDPTEFAQGVRLGEDKSLVVSEHYPDTQESAFQLVEAALRGDMDLPEHHLLSKKIYHCLVSPDQIGLHTVTIDAVSAILETLRQFRKTAYEPVKEHISITCNPPTADRNSYEVSIWQDDVQTLPK